MPNFGDASAGLLIVGLAPGAHGANRTGRMFTGDRSGDWLFRALHKAGFANQPTATDADDGLELVNCAITAVGHCAPPGNKPTRAEIDQCAQWLSQTLDLVRPRVLVALGGIAWRENIKELRRRGWYAGKSAEFGHAVQVQLAGDRHLIGCYHPSQQNTFTGRLTEEMLDSVFSAARTILG